MLSPKRTLIGKNSLQDIQKLGISIEIEGEKHPLRNLDEDDIEIAEMAHNLTKGQKDAIKTIIQGLAKKESEAA